MKENNIIKLTKEDFSTGTWAGGTTTQMGIYPQDALYSERNFIWRLSSATCDLDESAFTSLPDYDRVLIVLEGEVILEHKGIRTKKLEQYENDYFSGGYDTTSYGKITDFNLMTRKGNRGFAETISLNQENERVDMEEVSKGYRMCTQALFCCEDYAIFNINGESCMLKKGELAYYTGECSSIENIDIMGMGKAVRIQVYFDRISEIELPEEENKNIQNNAEKKREPVKEEKPPLTKDDVFLAALLCWSNFRGGKIIFRWLKDKWYDKTLQRAIGKLETLCIPMLICGVGVVVLGFLFLNSYGNTAAVWAIILWLILDYLIVSPMLYVLVMPRPVRKHIKKIDELEGEDLEQYIKEKGENKIAENILRKYKITGRNKYID